MRIILYIFIVLIFSACGTPKPKTYPKWYENRTLDSNVKYVIVGYGQGKSMREAKANAKEDIALILKSQVESSFSSKTTTQNNDFYKHKTSSILKIKTNLNLHNVKIIKQVQKDSLFFVALEYKNLDLAYRIMTTVPHLQCSQKRVNAYLSQTPLIQKLTATIGCTPDFKLERRNDAWYLQYKEYQFLLDNDNFEKLYTTIPNDAFSFIANKKVLEAGESFYFSFEAKKSGYITLLDVYENGIVTLLQSSTPIKGNLQIPSKESKNYFEAGLVKKGISTYDLYVAIYTKKPLNMGRFEYANDTLAQSETAYKFDELMDILDGVSFSSLLLRTKAN